MLNKLNVLLNIFNVLLIVFIISIFYIQKQDQSNLNGFFSLVQTIHNNVRQTPTTNVVIEKDEKHIESINEITNVLVKKDDESNENTFDFKNVEDKKEEIKEDKTTFANNLDKAIEVAANSLSNKKQEEVVKEEIKEEIVKVIEEIKLNMKDHSKDNFIYAKTIKTNKKINLYKDVNLMEKNIKLKGAIDIFVSKQEYNGLHKIMYKEKVYLIDKSNIDFPK